MKHFIFLLLVCQSLQFNVLAADCQSRDFGNGGTVCVCNADQCDRLEATVQVGENEFITYTSNKEGQRLNLARGNLQELNDDFENELNIDDDIVYQTVQGFGGAFTDSTGINILSLSENMQEELMKSYFHPDEGIGYNLGRIPMGGTDFSTHPYSYHDEEDPTLSKFALAQEDFELKIPIIKRAMALSPDLEFFTSTWTAPEWMKTNGGYHGPEAYLNESYHQIWADYFVKFLDEYAKQNVTFWGITTGNEPQTGFMDVKIPSVAWTAVQMRDWIRDYLGPTIRASSHSDIKLMTIDDQRMYFPDDVQTILADEEVKEYIDGLAVHWYVDIIINAQRLEDTHKAFPDKFILATEACEGFLGKPHVLLGAWERAQSYAKDIIEDMNHWVIGWVDWNMALDLEGGPTYIDNFVDSPIIVNATADEFYKQPMYYAMGHFAKFVPKGSVRIDISQISLLVPATAFKGPDGSIVVVILNTRTIEIDVVIKYKKRGQIPLQLSPQSITTLIF